MNQAHQTEPKGQHLARLRMQAMRQEGKPARGTGHLHAITSRSTGPAAALQAVVRILN